MILKIAKTELRTLFYSPIAWFLTLVFLVQCGITYFDMLDGFSRAQELGGFSLQNLKFLTSGVFGSFGGVFTSIMQKLYLYIPLLTMGLISREINGGTMKLLYSSPVKVREIVLGKFLAMMIYSLLLVLITGIFMVAAMFHIKSADGGMLLSAALGFYLLLCTYAAIGLFMSCLTTYQVVAAVSTFVMIGILSYIGQLWQDIDFVRDLTYFLSISGRTENMLTGLIVTTDVIYFLIIISVFLSISIFKLRGGRESSSVWVKAGRYVLVAAAALLIGYISSLPRFVGYLDLTATKSRTLTKSSQQIIREFGKQPMKVTVYTNLLGRFAYFGLPEYQNTFKSIWKPYTRFKPEINFEFVNYYDSTLDDNNIAVQYPNKSLKEVAEITAKSYKKSLSDFKTPAEIRKMIDLRPELNRYVMRLEFAGRSTFLRMFDDMQVFPSETEIDAALKRLLQAQIPKVAFLTGNYERNINKAGDREYKALTNMSTFRYALVNQGFDVDTVSLEDKQMPPGYSILVVADPKTVLSANTLSGIRNFIDNGGNLIIAGEPGKQSLLNPLLETVGVQMMDGVLVQPSKEFSPDLILTNITPFAATFTKALAKSFHDSVHVSMPGCTGIESLRSGTFTIRPLLTTDSTKSWKKTDKPVLDSADLVFSPSNGDQRMSVATSVALTRNIKGKEQRIIVCADADFLSNAESVGRFNMNVSNFTFNTGAFSWLVYGAFPVDTTRPESKDDRVTVSIEQVALLKIVFVWIVPAIILILATVLLIRRKRK